MLSMVANNVFFLKFALEVMSVSKEFTMSLRNGENNDYNVILEQSPLFPPKKIISENELSGKLLCMISFKLQLISQR